jgi:hypothetical protein
MVGDPVTRVILQRARARHRPGSRNDEYVVRLTVEYGRMRAAVSAGICAVLEAAGLVSAFDRVNSATGPSTKSQRPAD